MVSGELVGFKAADGLELNGFLIAPERKTHKAVVHIHGMTDNFYGSAYLWEMAKAANKKGWAFFSFDNRGHGAVSYLYRGKKIHVIGTALERFGKCLSDIDGALGFLWKLGYRKFVLSGQSTGCQKAVYYLNKRDQNKILGLVLLGPVDDRAWAKHYSGEGFGKTLKTAERMVEAGRGEEFLPKGCFDTNPISTLRYLSLVKGVEGEIMDYTKPKMGFFSKIRVPVLAAFCSKDEFMIGRAEELLAKMGNSAEKAKSFSAVILRGGSHSFFGREKQIGRVLEKWLGRL